MNKTGNVDTGVQETTDSSGNNQVEIKSGGSAVAIAFSGGVKSDYFVSNPSTISTTAEIPTGYNAVAAGPLTIGATGTLTIKGTLTIL
jgi:hypothetical protein